MLVTLRAVGKTPLLMHNEQLADPLNPIAREMAKIHSKRSKDKTEQDHEQLRYLEWFGGLYLDENKSVVMPLRNMRACLRNAAKKNRMGATVERALTLTALYVPFDYDGPRDIDALYKKAAFVHRCGVKAGSGKVMRTRPHFSTWSCEGQFELDEGELGLSSVEEFWERAGRVIGLCDGLDLGYGRFAPTVVKA